MNNSLSKKLRKNENKAKNTKKKNLNSVPPRRKNNSLLRINNDSIENILKKLPENVVARFTQTSRNIKKISNEAKLTEYEKKKYEYNKLRFFDDILESCKSQTRKLFINLIDYLDDNILNKIFEFYKHILDKDTKAEAIEKCKKLLRLIQSVAPTNFRERTTLSNFQKVAINKLIKQHFNTN